jgi:tetratricopeptide (TPR) repeat protein/transcriptional regulator with XRE-family HTH domain
MAGLSQEELAERSGLSVRTIGNLERSGARRPHRDTLDRLADALELDDAARAEFLTASGRKLRLDRGPARAREAGSPERPGAAEATASSAFQGHPPPAGGDVPVPRELPAGVQHFTGRDTEMGFLTAVLKESESADGAGRMVVISAIGGMAGVGKTAVALHWAHEQAGHFPDGQLYANLRGFDPTGAPSSAATVVRSFLEALGVSLARIPIDVEAQFGLYRSMLVGKRMLIVLDNAGDVSQVRSLIPGSAGCMVLVTSRSQLTELIALDGAASLTVGLLTVEEARELLARRLGAERIAREREAADTVIALCGRLPLALNIAAAHALTRPAMLLSQLAGELGDARRRLDVLSAGPDGADVRAVFSWSYCKLSAPAARLFRLLGLHPGPDVSLAAVASLAGLDNHETRRVLGEMTAAHVITEHVPGRYMLHDLLRMYAAEQARGHESEDEQRSGIQRMLDHYLCTAHAAAMMFGTHREPLRLPESCAKASGEQLADYASAASWCKAEEAVLTAAITCAANAGFATHAWQLAWSIETFPDWWRRWQDLAATSEIVLAAAARAADVTGQAHAHHHLGKALARGGRYQEARGHLQRAVALLARLRDRLTQADAELSLVEALCELDELAPALARSAHALRLYQAVGHHAGQARALNCVGWVHLLLRRYQPGLAYCERAVELARQADDPYMRYLQVSALDSIGYAHHLLGHHAVAVARYRQALRAHPAEGETGVMAVVLDHLGDSYEAGGARADALRSWGRAMSIFEDIQHPAADRIRAKINDAGSGRVTSAQESSVLPFSDEIGGSSRS